MPTIWFSLFELKLQQYGLLADEQRKNALASCPPNDVLLIIRGGVLEDVLGLEDVLEDTF